MQDSAKDWSRGDLPGFMRSYENAPDTAYVTPQGLIRGYDALTSHYKPTTVEYRPRLPV